VASSYPGALDSLANPTASDAMDSVTVPHADQHADANDAIEAVQAELGTDPAGASATVKARLDALDTTVAGKVSFPLDNTAATATTAQYSTDVTGDSVDRFTVDAAGMQSWGSGSAVADVTLRRSSARTLQLTGLLNVTPATGATGNIGILFGDATPAVSGNVYFLAATGGCTPSVITTPPSEVFGLNFAPSVAQGSLTSPYPVLRAIQANPVATYDVTAAHGVWVNYRSIASTTTTYTGVRIGSAVAFGGAITTSIGLKIESLTGTTVWGMQVDDYQSYHTGRLTLGATTAPTYALDLKGTAQNRGVIALIEAAATPTAPSTSDQVLMYAKTDRIVFCFQDGATTRYKSLLLTGTGVTWVHSTTAP
jgi:hypothetical protein